MKKQKSNNHQHQRAAKEARRKAVLATRKKEQPLASHSLIHRSQAAAKAFEVSYCLMTKDIFDIGIGHVILGRTISSLEVALGAFMVDVYCLGVKNGFYGERTHDQLKEMLDKMAGNGHPFTEVAPECARKLVEGAVAYAKNLGFAPHADYAPAAALFGDIDAEACLVEYEFGKDGKPFFVSGPNDTPAMIRRTVRTLTDKVGEGNFDFMVAASGL